MSKPFFTYGTNIIPAKLQSQLVSKTFRSFFILLFILFNISASSAGAQAGEILQCFTNYSPHWCIVQNKLWLKIYFFQYALRLKYAFVAHFAPYAQSSHNTSHARNTLTNAYFISSQINLYHTQVVINILQNRLQIRPVSSQ